MTYLDAVSSLPVLIIAAFGLITLGVVAWEWLR